MYNGQLTYLYLFAPLHTGGASQEGNLVGIAKESHTDLPYLPSSTMRGRLRAETPSDTLFVNTQTGELTPDTPEAAAADERNPWKRTSTQFLLWGNTIGDVTQGNSSNLTQGTLWLGDASILWFPVPSLSHGVVWVTCPLLLRRWMRLTGSSLALPSIGSFSDGNRNNLYLKDAVFKKGATGPDALKSWDSDDWHRFFPIPAGPQSVDVIDLSTVNVLVLSDQNCRILIESSLWRQVRVNLDEQKTVVGGFRYEEAIPPETLMYFPWGANAAALPSIADFCVDTVEQQMQGTIKQFGGQESLGRGFVKLWSVSGQAEQANRSTANVNP